MAKNIANGLRDIEPLVGFGVVVERLDIPFFWSHSGGDELSSSIINIY